MAMCPLIHGLDRIHEMFMNTAGIAIVARTRAVGSQFWTRLMLKTALLGHQEQGVLDTC